MTSTLTAGLMGDLLAGRVGQVFLKQFRDAADGTRACYQSVVEAPVQIRRVESGLAPRDWAIQVHPLDSHPIGDELGVGDQSAKLALRHRDRLRGRGRPRGRWADGRPRHAGGAAAPIPWVRVPMEREARSSQPPAGSGTRSPSSSACRSTGCARSESTGAPPGSRGACLGVVPEGWRHVLGASAGVRRAVRVGAVRLSAADCASNACLPVALALEPRSSMPPDCEIAAAVDGLVLAGDDRSVRRPARSRRPWTPRSCRGCRRRPELGFSDHDHLGRLRGGVAVVDESVGAGRRASSNEQGNDRGHHRPA